MIDTVQVIERFKKSINIKSDKQAANLLGLSPQDFSSRKKRGSLITPILSFSLQLDINLHWLLTGDESVLVDKPHTDQSSYIMTIALTDEAGKILKDLKPVTRNNAVLKIHDYFFQCFRDEQQENSTIAVEDYLEKSLPSIQAAMHALKKVLLVIFLFCTFLPHPLFAWPGKVVEVTDGDTITVLNEQKQLIRIRLWGIDTPERGHDFGARARQATSEMAFGKTAEVEEVDRDRYGRAVAVVSMPDGQVLNEKLVLAGYAWVYRRYCTRNVCSKWLELEAEAKTRKQGLWSMPAIPPWDFRKLR